MELKQDIYREIKSNNNIITTSKVLEMGYSKTMLTKYVKEGILERVRQGVYILPGEVEDDMYTLMLSSKNIVFSHETALYLNGLSERTPFVHSITIPSNSSVPKTIAGECICFYIKRELYEIGMIEKRTTFGNLVCCYNGERTICDILRSRSRMDEETVISAMKNYAEFKDRDLNKLFSYAKQFQVDKIARKYLGVLL